MTLLAPHVTEATIQARIIKVEYARIGLKTTVACLTLDNGYEVIGLSACVDPANFQEDIGQDLAYKDAFEKCWPLFGFLLAEENYHG
jgi:Phage protein (N4 Gp49/phage Sf6 gene 66) family